MKAMLAKEVERPVDFHLDNDDWWMQQKFDGRRLVVELHEGWQALNRNGEAAANLTATITKRLDRAFATFLPVTTPWYVDGELVGEWFVIFDLVVPSTIPAELPYHRRLEVLERFFDDVQAPGITVVKTAKSTEGKREMFSAVRERGGEGVVFRHRDSAYVSGHRSQLLKYKFTKSVDCMVVRSGVDGKNNVTLGLWSADFNTCHNVGKCSAEGKGSISAGDVVEVEFLYTTESNRLYQPRIKRVRTDKNPIDCAVDQLDGTHTNRKLIV